MIICDNGELIVKGKTTEICANSVTILAYLYQKKMLPACLEVLSKMIIEGTIDKVFEEDKEG